MNKILINGCSFTQGPQCWPGYLPESYDITNLALGAAGNEYIYKSTINELIHNDYDMVIIMWSDLYRINKQVNQDTISLLDDCKPMLSKYIINCSPIESDNEKIQKDWVFSNPHEMGRNTNDTYEALFKPLYAMTADDAMKTDSMLAIISLQNFLKEIKMPYIFMFICTTTIDDINIHRLSKFIDWDNTYIDDNIFSIAQRNNWIASYDEWHPGDKAHQYWGDKVSQYLKENYE